MSRRRSISLIATGGTISIACSGTEASRSDQSGRIERHGARDLVPADDDLPPGVEVHPVDASRRSSREMTLEDLWSLAEAVRAEIARGHDGVVITHGTDTLEETAYALSLLVGTPVPVVVTGAMRAPHLTGPDGAANVRAALIAAADPDLARYGPVVVLHDEVHVARLVTKMYSARVAAFASPAAGPVGYLAEDKLELLLGPPPQPDILPRTAPPSCRVEIIPTATGIDGEMVERLAPHADGLVVAALGAGHVSPPLAAALIRVVESGRPVVVASRCPDGTLLAHTYTGPGSETDLRQGGLLHARNLNGQKTRLRLAFGLSAGVPAETLFPR